MSADEIGERLHALMAQLEAQFERIRSQVDAAMASENKALAAFDRRLTALEAAVIIQTGTVFGAQGDSDPMTIEHTIPEPPLNEWKA